MKTATLFGIAAMSLTTLGAASAFATPTLTVTVGSYSANPSFISLGSGNYYTGPSQVGGVSWGDITAAASDPTSSGAYQLSLTIHNLSNGNSGSSTVNFVASDNGFTLPANQGIGQIQANLTTNVTSGTTAESIASGGSVNSDSTTLSTISFVSATGLAEYGQTGSTVSINAASNIGTVTLGTSDSLTLSHGTLINSVNSVVLATPTTVTTPEPATLALFAVGGLALLAAGRRHKSRS